MESTMEQLLPGARGALIMAALLDDPFPLQALVASGVSPESLDPLFDKGMLEEASPEEATLDSNLNRDQILKTATWSEKRKYCSALADTYIGLSLDSVIIGRLLVTAQRHREAREQLVIGAKSACSKNDYRTALQLMNSALEIWPTSEDPIERTRVLKELARCAENCSDFKKARSAWSELLESNPASDNPAERIKTYGRLAKNAEADGDRVFSRECLKSAAQLAEENGFIEESARLWRRLAQAQGDALKIKDALVTLETVKSLAIQSENRSLHSDTMSYFAMLSAMLGKIEIAQTYIEEALAIAIENDLPEQITNAYRRQANVNEFSSNYKAYRDNELQALDRCRNLGQDDGTRACLTCVSYAFFRLGQYDESLSAIEEATCKLELDGQLLAGAVTIKACIHVFCGLGDSTESLLREASKLVHVHAFPVFGFYALQANGMFHMLNNQPEGANHAFSDLIELWRETDDRKDSTPGLVTACSFYADNNNGQKLSACLDILNTIQSSSEADEPRFAFLAASAEDAWLRGNTDMAAEYFRKAISGYNSLHLPFEEIWLTWRLGIVLSASNLNEQAYSVLKGAALSANKLALKPLEAKINELIRKCRISGSVTETPLTRRQLEIARLLATGMTNKEAADKLGISPRTVEMHVAALLDRLECRTRAEAVKRTLELGLLS